MWEAEALDFENVSEDSLREGGKRTKNYLRRAGALALEIGIPLCIAAEWSFKGQRIVDLGVDDDKRDVCVRCGLSFRRYQSFKMKLKRGKSCIRYLQAVCRGCGQLYQCGQIYESNMDDETSMNDSVLDKTINMGEGPSATSTPIGKGRYPLTPAKSNPRITQIQNQHRKTRKRRGSALERLLKEEESESDRSLNSFLNSFSK